MSRHLPEILRHLDIDICLNLMTIRTSPKQTDTGLLLQETVGRFYPFCHSTTCIQTKSSRI